MLGRIKALWIVGIVGSIILISCCRGEYLIIGIERLEATQTLTDSTSLENHITGPFNINVFPQLELLQARAIPLVSPAMATTCEYDYSNSVTDVALFLDKDLIYNSDTLVAGYNLMNHLQYVYNEDYRWVECFVSIDSAFLSFAEFDSTNYEFEVVISTSDSKSFGATIDLFMNVE